MNPLLDCPVFLGAGAMGGRLARRAAVQGLRPRLWNRSSDRAVALAGDGLEAVRDLVDALTGATVVVTCLADDSAVLALTDDMAFDRLAPRTLVIDCSSTLPSTSQAVAAALTARGLRAVDAPISGGPEAAEAGTLSFLCGGKERDVGDAKALLAHLGTTATHVGDHGAGQMAKLISQILMAGTLLGAAEGIGLAKAGGVDGEALIRALLPGAAGSWVLEHRAPFMVSDEYPRAGALALHRKDLDNVITVAGEFGLDLPGVRLVKEIEARLERRGFGDENVAAIARAYSPRPPGDPSTVRRATQPQE